MTDNQTTTDYLTLNLDGPITDAIASLTDLASQYPDGTLELETECEYGSWYSRLYLRFERPKSAIEIQYDAASRELKDYKALTGSARVFEVEGIAFPRQHELTDLRARLGAWAVYPFRSCSLTIADGEIVINVLGEGLLRRDGSWLARAFLPSPARTQDTPDA